ncbi:unnamed protein product [Cylindrotheca closterium]|uniref:J domain-containing protein n=1 Tax=Cylindrotheca closterium TaxID=2856 RepID=A0AAD2FN19_9STRA|nr:unnamed protein product [Cylindrotheca closterium]
MSATACLQQQPPPTTTLGSLQWPPALDPWIVFSTKRNGMTRRLNGAKLYLLNRKSQTNLTFQIVHTMGGQVTREMEEATHALWIQNSQEEDYTQNIECSLARSLNIPIVDANLWLQAVTNLRDDQHWSEVNCEGYEPSIKRRDLHLVESLSQTLQVLSQEDPNFLEENALKRALELSLLDCALVVRQGKDAPVMSRKNNETETPYQVLGVDKAASRADIKKAYRRLARIHHPDKGGSASDFERIARAYQSILVSSTSSVVEKGGGSLKSTAHWDSELKDHRRLVQELFTSHGANLDSNISSQVKVMTSLGLQAVDAGSINFNEQNQKIENSCFYLSLATSYLSGIGAMDNMDEDIYMLRQTALSFKRFIEAAVVAAHPEWVASGQVGEHVQAFSDFLVYLLDSRDAMISDWAIVIFDTTSGVCDIYKGKYYEKMSEEGKAANTLTIQYLPGHYQPLLIDTHGGLLLRPNLDQILKSLDEHGVLYVVTDGSA